LDFLFVQVPVDERRSRALRAVQDEFIIIIRSIIILVVISVASISILAAAAATVVIIRIRILVFGGGRGGQRGASSFGRSRRKRC
jgi:hypothetical protein